MKTCKIKGCNKKHEARDYCKMHYTRLCRHGDPSIVKYKGCRGEKNPRWKGGISKYPNRIVLRKNRLIILMNNPKCEVCGKEATQVHHKDLGKTNHELSNLMAVCHKCHFGRCHKLVFKNRKSKYQDRYGKTKKELAKINGVSPDRIERWENQGRSFLI